MDNHQTQIKLRGVRTHNLKNLNLDIQMNKITCVYGPSGSGKSSLAFHTLLTESKRRYINSLPTDMKFFWEIPHTVQVDLLYPVLPAWGLPQHNPVIHSRPVALDVLGGHDKLQKIFFYLGNYYCSQHQIPFLPVRNTVFLYEKIKKLKLKKLEDEVVHFFVTRSEYTATVKSGVLPTRSLESSEIGVVPFDEVHDYWEVFRLKIKDFEDPEILAKKIHDSGFSLEQRYFVYFLKNKVGVTFESKFIHQCPRCDEVDDGKSDIADALSPLNALGACSDCQGHGMKLIYDKNKLVKDPTKSLREGAVNVLSFSHFNHLIPAMLREAKKHGFDIDTPFEKLPKTIWNFLYKGSGSYEGLDELLAYLDSKKYKKTTRIYARGLQTEELCETCQGARVSKRVGDLAILVNKEKITFRDFLLSNLVDGHKKLQQILTIAKDNQYWSKVRTSMQELDYLYQVSTDLGLGHLSNVRKVRSLSSSEYQRILLSKFLSYRGSQSLFVLDEPSLGLSLKTQKILMKYLYDLRDQGNTIVMVEHSEFMKSIADEVIEMGPHAGTFGGEIIYQGPYKKMEVEKYTVKKFTPTKKEFLTIYEPEIRNIKKDQLTFQKNAITWVNGESGVGKSSLVVELLANEIHRQINGTKLFYSPYKFKKIEGNKDISDVIIINGSVDKVSSRSSVGTYTELGGFVKKHFTNLEISKSMNLKEGHFSSNSELGMCLACMGRGVKIVEMHFMEDVEFVCDECQGKKLKPFYANISDGNMTVFEAHTKPLTEVLSNIRLTPKGKRIFDYMQILKLDYLSLDRSLTSLSGGERQRLYLLTLLNSKIENGLIIFENLSSGLSIHELGPLSTLLHQLCGNQNTVVVIDQNPYFEKIAHYQLNIT